MPILGSQSAGTKGPSSAPTIGTATAGNALASVTFTAPSFSKLPITSYTVTSSPGGFTATGANSPITVSGLSNGTSYTFTVTATNANGTSVASSSSNSATPAYPKVGFITGGYAAGQVSSIYKLVFTSETTATSSSVLPAVREGTAGMANSGTAGYTSGGTTSSTRSAAIIKLIFSGETVSTLAATLTVAKDGLSAYANSGTAGYVAGGNDGTNYSSAIDKVAFSNDGKTTVAATLSTQRYGLTGMANSGTAGYTGGGYDGLTTFLSGIDKLAFSNDSKSTLSATLTTTKRFMASFANSGTAGYFAGGQNGPADGDFKTALDKIAFSNDAKSTLAGVLSSNHTAYGSGVSNSGTAGYKMGGSNYLAGTTTAINKVLYSTDTVSTLSAVLPAAVTNGSWYADSGTL